MTRLVLTENRLPEVSFDRHSDPAKGNPNGYRFGRISGWRARGYTGRAARGARGFFGAMLEMIAASKMRRIERELRVRGVRYDSVRFDGDRFTSDAD
jgi:hypothetical protein